MSAVGALLRKELRQARRSRGAIVSTTVLSFLLIVVTPLGQLAGLNAGGPKLPAGMPFDLSEDPSEVFAQVLMPLFLAFAGLVVPSVAAVHTIVVERERRSVELLIALPVRVHDILAAKLISILLLSAAVMLPLFLIDAAALLAFGLARLVDIAMMLLVLAASALCSVALALLVALVARDFRTANNLNGLILGPALMVVTGVIFLAPSALRLPVLAALLVAVGVLAMVVAFRWLTFERYLA